MKTSTFIGILCFYALLGAFTFAAIPLLFDDGDSDKDAAEYHNEDRTQIKRNRYGVSGGIPMPAPVPMDDRSKRDVIYIRGKRIELHPESARSIRNLNGHMPYAGHEDYKMPLYIKGTPTRFYYKERMPRAGE